MANLIYSAISSLDGYVEDSEGRFDWAEPDDEVHAFANELDRSIGTHLYGRRMYETMVFWETAGSGPEVRAVFREFAGIWRAADKVVYSRTLQEPSSERTRIEREFEPEAIRQWKLSSATDISVAGAELSRLALDAGLVDECHLFLCPIVVGGGKRTLSDTARAELELLDHRRFESGVVHLHYRTSTTGPGHP